MSHFVSALNSTNAIMGAPLEDGLLATP